MGLNWNKWGSLTHSVLATLSSFVHIWLLLGTSIILPAFSSVMDKLPNDFSVLWLSIFVAMYLGQVIGLGTMKTSKILPCMGYPPRERMGSWFHSSCSLARAPKPVQWHIHLSWQFKPVTNPQSPKGKRKQGNNCDSEGSRNASRCYSREAQVTYLLLLNAWARP